MHGRTTRAENDHAPSQYIEKWLDSVTDGDGDPQQQADKYQACLQTGERKAKSYRNSPAARCRTSQPLHPPEHLDRNQQTDNAHKSDGPHKAFLTASPTASQKYARRRRHKTKADRYEYKAETSAEINRGAKAKSQKRHNYRRDVATLNQDFKAPNVESERLTLKHGSLPGFLGKGKASDSIDRRGLPDLTFSEMTFLGKTRQLDDARFRGLQAMTATTKDKGAARDISAYFSDQGGNVDRSISAKHPRDASVCPESHENPDEAQMHGIAEVASRHDTPIHQENYPHGRLEARGITPYAMQTVHPRSSVSNVTLPRRYRDSILGHSLMSQQYCFLASPEVKKQHYSLEDLKQLAGSTDKVKHMKMAVTTREDVPLYPVEGALPFQPTLTRTSFLMGKKASLSLKDADDCPVVNEAACPSRQQRAPRAYPDPVLMPQRDFGREATNELRTIPEGASLPEAEYAPIAARSTWETYRPGANGYGLRASYKIPGPEGKADEWMKDGLDEFDANLLDSICHAEFQLESVGDQTVSEAAIHDRRTGLEHEADAVSARSSWDVQDIGVTIANEMVAREGHTRARLLRPSQQAEQASPTFSGFKRPRLLY